MAKPQLKPLPAKVVLVSLASVAADLSVHPVTIWRWVNSLEGFPEPVRVGLSKIAFYEHEINEFKRNRTRRSSAPLPPKKRRIDSVKRQHQSP